MKSLFGIAALVFVMSGSACVNGDQAALENESSSAMIDGEPSVFTVLKDINLYELSQQGEIVLFDGPTSGYDRLDFVINFNPYTLITEEESTIVPEKLRLYVGITGAEQLIPGTFDALPDTVETFQIVPDTSAANLQVKLTVLE
jgi:hypothetical protein